jgi:hypothetical protein
MAREIRAAFVAGLIRRSCFGRSCNTACLITGSESTRLLSQKVGRDSSLAVYEPCSAVDRHEDFDGATIAALICMDFTPDNTRRQKIVKCLRNRQCPILCVPTNTNIYRTATFGSDVPDAHVIVANGRSLHASRPDSNDYCPSIIQMKGDSAPRQPFQDRRNVIRLERP